MRDGSPSGGSAKQVLHAQSSRAVLQMHYSTLAPKMQALMYGHGLFTSVGTDPGVACLCHSHPRLHEGRLPVYTRAGSPISRGQVPDASRTGLRRAVQDGPSSMSIKSNAFALVSLPKPLTQRYRCAIVRADRP